MVTPPVLMVVPSLVMDVFSQVGPYAFLPPLKLKPLLAMFISSVVMLICSALGATDYE